MKYVDLSLISPKGRRLNTQTELPSQPLVVRREGNDGFINNYFFCIILVSLFFSCSSANKDNGSSTAAVQLDSVKHLGFDKSLLVANVKCAKDTSISYALYIPKKYLTDKKNSVIYFFDSHGSGSLPLEKYKELAEKYGYVLAGSNNSKNGMSWEQSRPQIKMFMDDVKSRLNIDERRIYTCGFSGGSRVACSVAINEGGVNCVIGMGAGLPNIKDPIRNRFDYIGFAGNEDFNMNEMTALLLSMDKSPIRHQLIIFNGKHEWTPAEIADDAFVWLDVNAMKDGLISRNDSLLKSFLVKNDVALKEASKQENMYEELFLSKKLVNFLEGLADVSEYKKKAEELSNSDKYKNLMTKKETLNREEFSNQEKYRSNFVMKNFAWWSIEINKLKRNSRDKNNEELALMNKRLIGYLSLVAYMNANSAYESKQFDLMEKFLKIYQLVDPENSEHQYLFADLYSTRKNNSMALTFLKNAVKLGFADIARVESDTALSALRSSPEYNGIVQDIKSKK